MASKQRFDKLTPKEQAVIRDSVIEMQPKWRKTIAERSIEARKICEEKGLQVSKIDYPAFKKAMDPVYTEFRQKIGAEFFDRVVQAANA